MKTIPRASRFGIRFMLLYHLIGCYIGILAFALWSSTTPWALTLTIGYLIFFIAYFTVTHFSSDHRLFYGSALKVGVLGIFYSIPLGFVCYALTGFLGDSAMGLYIPFYCIPFAISGLIPPIIHIVAHAILKMIKSK